MDRHQRQPLAGQPFAGEEILDGVERRHAHVRLIAAVRAHGLLVGQPREWRLDLVARHGGDPLEQRLDDLENSLLLREGHLEVDLREFRLPVGAQVLVPETAHDLEVLLEAADHQKLLEELRRLRKGVKTAALHAAGNQVVSGALGSRAPHEGCLDFQEPLRRQQLARGEGYLRAQYDVALHVRPAQVDIAVLEPRFLAHVDFFLHRERRRAGFVQNPQLVGDQFDLTGRQAGEDGLRRSAAATRPSTATTYSERSDSALAWTPSSASGVKNDLGDTVAVAQVDEDNPAEVVTPVDPAHQKGARARIGGAQLATSMRASQFAEKIQRYATLHVIVSILIARKVRSESQSAVRPSPYP